MIKLKSSREISKMRAAGLIVAEALQQVKVLAKPGVTTADFDRAVASIFAKYDATPLFRGYPNPHQGKPAFPAVICASVNEAVVHGIPNNRVLVEGDIVSVDTGCSFDGWCGDSAITVPIGRVSLEVQRLLDVTSHTLDLAISAMSRCKTWYDVASLMERYVKSQQLSVIEKFVGHGIGQKMHEEPQVPNFVSKALRNNNILLEPGLVLAIEPMVGLGTKNVETLADSWTVVTKDRRPSAHFEHTVAMTTNGPIILTLPDLL